jgi:hypothetical protein
MHTSTSIFSRPASSLLAIAVLCSTGGIAAADRSDRPQASQPTKEVGGGVAGIGCSCFGDLDASGIVDAADLAVLLGAWGGVGAADLDANGGVDAADLALLLGAWGFCPVAPANDLCENSIEIGEGVTAFCTINATSNGPVYGVNSPCNEFGYNSIYADVWYTYTAIGDGELTVSTCGTTWDTRLAVYGIPFAGPIGCPGGQFSLVGVIGCNDDAQNCQTGSKVTVPVVAGHQYKIRVGGFIGFEGNGTLDVDFVSAGSSCLDAIQLGSVDGLSVSGTTLDNDTGADQSPCGLSDTVAEWYSFENTCPGDNTKITISTCNEITDFDTVLTVWKQGMNGCTDTLVECNDDATGAACQIGGLQRKSRVSFFASPGAIYYVRVGGYNGQKGDFAINFTVEDCGL